MMAANTLFLRLEGPLQAWGNHESKFGVRRTNEAPTKSGVIGMLCAAMGIGRSDARPVLAELGELGMGVRIDRPPVRWWDYHTVGAGMQVRIAGAEDKTKPGALLSRREYLCDASYLVVLQGDADWVTRLDSALLAPRWAMYLGRKCCVPSRPIREREPGEYDDLGSALKSVVWRQRLKTDTPPDKLSCLLDWRPSADCPEAPADALIWYDVPVSFEPPAHRARFVVRDTIEMGLERRTRTDDIPLVQDVPKPVRPRANYSNSKYRERRRERLDLDEGLCVFCKGPATTVQHITYRHAGGNERPEELRSLCRLCHDAVTMLEYGAGMGLDRINPEDSDWRDDIIAKRHEIVAFRSLEVRRRRLSAEEVE